MRFLIVGLGSMGKRRIRNLRALGHQDVAGFDPREDRRAEAAAKCGVETYDSAATGIARFRPDAIVISTDPAHHMDYALPAADAGIPCFIEASVVDRERIAELDRRTRKTGIVMAPSCTMRYFPGPRAVHELINKGAIGRPLSYNYQTGQYLPDWHPWEDIRDFYVSRKETGGCREIVPFELTWLTWVFGHPEPLACVRGKVTDMDADIDDVYHCIFGHPGNVLASVTVEVVSRPVATRELRVLGSEGELVFSGEDALVKHIRVGEADWTKVPLSVGSVEDGYINPEEPYIAEMADFVRAAEAGDPTMFPNTLADDLRVLNLLHALEDLKTANR